MATYKQSGVDSLLGDACSEIAYRFAKQTFLVRKKAKIGRPLLMEGGFTGVLDMGGFYLVQNEDGVGTKMLIAEQMKKFGTVGYDLAAMVADDAVCVGAEVVGISNTIDTMQPDKKVVGEMMRGLAKACKEQKIVIPGGEIASLKGMAQGYIWNSTAMGVVEKNKFITGDNIRPGDVIIGLHSPNFRSNGFTLIRYILQKIFGANWIKKPFRPTERGKTWGEATLEPSIIYHDAVLSLHGRFGEKSKVRLKGVAHITGGGLPGNAPRVFGRKKYGMRFDNLFPVPAVMSELQKLGRVSDREAYETWNMGTGMILVVAPRDSQKALRLLKQKRMKAQIIGKIVHGSGVTIRNLFWK